MEYHLEDYQGSLQHIDMSGGDSHEAVFTDNHLVHQYSETLGQTPEYTEIHTVLADGSDRFSVSAVAFDTQEELLWMGNQGGHVTSYYGLSMQKYTSFQAHASQEIRQILTIDTGMLALTNNALRCQSRQGVPIFTYSSESMQAMQCMLLTGNNSLLMGGHQNQLIELDLNQMEEIMQIDVGEPGCAILRHHPRFLCTGDISGKVTLRDPKTLKVEHTLEAHSGTLSDFDAHGNLLITCGFSNRLGGLVVDRFLMVYDLRAMRAVAPIQLTLDPLLLRFVPTFTSRVAVVSQTGQFQLVETGALTSSSMYLYQTNTEGSLCLTFDVSSSYQSLALGDTSGYLHLFCNSTDATFNPFSRPAEFADPVEAIPSVDINDELTPLSTIPLPITSGTLLSDWPSKYCKVVYRYTPPIDAVILQSMKMVQSIGYAPNPGTCRRNQVPYKSEDKKKNRKCRIPASPIECGDDPFIMVPKRYRKVEVKYSKLGIEDFDFDHYNKTSFAGLESSLPNSYCNAMLQVLYFIEPIRSSLLSHLCHQEFCMACELGFLFDMLDNSKGMPCQASNFLRAFRTIPEAAALGLILNDSDEARRKANLPRLIQSFNRFILQQVHTETVEILDEMETNYQNETLGGKFDSSHQSVISRLFGTELFTCTQCQCSEERQLDSTTLLFSLLYPDSSLPGPGKPATQYTFADILKRSLCLEQVTQSWCEKCDKYQPTVLSRRLKNLPDVLSINCGLDTSQDITFWKNQMEILFDKEEIINKSAVSNRIPAKPCRYGNMCTKKNCKFQHPWNTKIGEIQSSVYQQTEDMPVISWLPLGVHICLLDDGQVSVNAVSQPDKEKITNSNDEVLYHLIAVVSHIRDPRGLGKDSIVACIKAGPNYHQRSMGSPVSQWYLFNDFSITPIAQEEAVWFNLDWKIPCVLFLARTDLNERHTLQVVNPITTDVFLEDKSLAMRGGRRRITFTPLGLEEMLGRGDIVAMDAEFVTLNQLKSEMEDHDSPNRDLNEESELRSDGTRSTIKPSQMSVARITCIRGQGPLEGTPFIDDYISTQEQVVDYLTKFSGIKPGDLDATISSKHLTTLKSTYLKLRYLIDRGVKFVGHGLKNDFRVINLVVPADQVIDTVLLFHIPHQRMISLRFLAWHFLGLKIQSITHDSIEDARTAMKLYHRYLELESERKVKAALKELYENGRNLQWKVPGMED